MFEQLPRLPADPILGLMTLFAQDAHPQKVDLGVGVYKTEAGLTPVMTAIKQAEQTLVQEQTSKVYVAPAGNARFLAAMGDVLWGEEHRALQPRLASIQTPGGCGALRVAAELIKTANPNASIWVSNPTWGNHMPLLGSAGLALKTYPYFDAATHALDWDGLVQCLQQVPAGDLVLLHGCCHNPTGVDLTPQQWQQIAVLASERGFTPFVDMAYQGFGETLDADAYGLRYLAQQLPEVVFAVSCSKNFGLYRERVGLMGVVSASASAAEAAMSQLTTLVRGIYSMPPDHGAELVARVLTTPALNALWQQELVSMRDRIQGLRQQFVQAMQARGAGHRFDFIAQQRGMFSFLGLNPQQVAQLQTDSHIYMLANSRASIAGLNQANLSHVCDAVARIL